MEKSAHFSFPGNEDRVRILSVIDKLRELGVSEDVSLPQVKDHLNFEMPSSTDPSKDSSSG